MNNESFSSSSVNLSTEPYNFQLDDNRLLRNFDTLITERQEFVFQEEEEPFIKFNLYDTIQEKMFAITEGDDVDLTEENKKEYTEKYNILDTKNTIKQLKDNISKAYFKKIEHSVLIQERRRIYTSFCNNILESIKYIDQIVKNPTDEDNQLKILLYGEQ